MFMTLGNLSKECPETGHFSTVAELRKLDRHKVSMPHEHFVFMRSTPREPKV